MVICLLAIGVYGLVNPLAPLADETTNADIYDFTATSTNPLLDMGLPPFPLLYLELDFDGLKQMDCTGGPLYDCELL